MDFNRETFKVCLAIFAFMQERFKQFELASSPTKEN